MYVTNHVSVFEENAECRVNETRVGHAGLDGPFSSSCINKTVEFNEANT